jgi:hypothetical protein
VVKKQKTHRHDGSGFDKFRERSKPNRRAGQQRVRKQQVQIAIHAGKLVLSTSPVNGIRFQLARSRHCGKGV